MSDVGARARLDVDSVADYLRDRGVVAPDVDLSAEVLAGGVSNDVLGVWGDGVDLVVKQGLERLRVKAVWLAPPERVLTEGAAIKLAATMRPDDVPRVVDMDEDRLVLTIERAPRAMRVWKTDLLDGLVQDARATRVGAALGEWHRRTAGDPEVYANFDRDAFVQLRIDPFHRTVEAAHPDLAARIEITVTDLLGPPQCLVHGDFSPKNILADDERVCVLDWEVAHAGDPVFDLAFLVTHLMLKAVRRPELAQHYHALGDAFLSAYAVASADFGTPPDTKLALHVGCLLLARVDGKSPVEYLDDAQLQSVRALARAVLEDPQARPDDIWDRIGGGS